MEGRYGLAGVSNLDGEELSLGFGVMAEDVLVTPHQLQLALRLLRQFQPAFNSCHQHPLLKGASTENMH